MPNTTITYTAKRRLMSGVAENDVITLELNLVTFDKAIATGESSVDMINGDDIRTLHYIRDEYTCATGIIPTAQTADMQQFFYSVMAGEEFTMTNLDEADRLMQCKLRKGTRPSQSRPDPKNLNRFRYQFAVQEVE